MLKAAKKLKKFWSRKKRRKKNQHLIHEASYCHPPPTSHCCCSCSASTQPSAPPLPPWLQYEQTNEAISTSELLQTLPELAYPGQTEFPSHDIVVETNPIYYTLPANEASSSSSSSSSYQQYMVPNPVYGVPLVQTPRREKSGFVYMEGKLTGCHTCPGASITHEVHSCKQKPNGSDCKVATASEVHNFTTNVLNPCNAIPYYPYALLWPDKWPLRA